MDEGNFSCLANCIDDIKKKIAILTLRHRTILKSEPLIAFRGESRDYGDTKLTPSLFRDYSYVNKEVHLFELFCDYNIVSQSASNIERAIETQHYASISRMLDISFDVLVALYFACAHAGECDGYVYVFAFPEHYSPHSKYIEEFYTNVLDEKHIAYSRNFKVFSHSYTNDRIKAQKGGFIFFPGKEFQPINNCYYEMIPIHKDDKKKILQDLEVLFQINEATLFPEKDKIAGVVKKKFESSTYIPKKITLENEIDSFISRIDYELKIQCLKESAWNSKDILRWLRKEKDDIKNYIIVEAKKVKEQDKVQDIEKKLCEKIEKDFQILQLRYMEVSNGE